jgi:uncharacterized membrane protein YccC
MIEPGPMLQTAPSPLPLPLWHGDGLAARSIRFALTVMAPVLAGLWLGDGSWVAYGILVSIFGFLLDTGGPARERLWAVATAGALVLAGSALGTLAHGAPGLTTAVLVLVMMIYGLLESADPAIAFGARLLCISTAIAALFSPLATVDVPAVVIFVGLTWAISVGWDALTGIWRPSVAPRPGALFAHLRATGPERRIFAGVVGLTTAAVLQTATALGLQRPHWALLAIVIVMRADAKLTGTMVRNLLLGTLAGVLLTIGYERLFPTAFGLTIGMVIAALLRWPAHQLNGGLGLGAMAAFILLLLQLVTLHTGIATHAPAVRMIDTALGCAFVLAGIGLNRLACRVLLGRPAKSAPPADPAAPPR